MSQPDPLNWTLLFKKHKTTVLLMLPPSETITNTKTTLLNALRSRDSKDINGDPIPEHASDIEFGVPVDKNDLEKGWTPLELELPFDGDEAAKREAEKRTATLTLQAAGLKSGKPVAFRFRKPGSAVDNPEDIDLQLEEPGWDVVLPSLEDEEGEPV
ncbi:hypothetical protein FE257_012605 [Aspergillus nanangensis]|uniref:Uncharacterized protein n=1 Tax=Aspergillus nanangensis TaxID=2582783 RepID=A0AAD4CFX1_ASPNN|nr:hypothetical protein FE257_012605 [Aspergillus nanangensis]